MNHEKAKLIAEETLEAFGAQKYQTPSGKIVHVNNVQ